MDFWTYLANNVPLFSICLVMIFISFRNLKVRRKESILFLVFTAIVLFLSVVVNLEKYSQKVGNVIAEELMYIDKMPIIKKVDMIEEINRRVYTPFNYLIDWAHLYPYCFLEKY